MDSSDSAMNIPPPVEARPKKTEKSPLLPAVQRRLFRSLSGWVPGIARSRYSDEDDVGGNITDSVEEATDDVEALVPDAAVGHVRTLGTFAGVFAPVALSMFSALLFLRVGFVVGNAGVLETVLQYLVAYTILFLTVMSICAISTNGAVEGGGAYYVISRTLGPEFGGSIGALFFSANVFSCALYATGTVEGIVSNFGPNVMISRTLGPEFGGSIGALFFSANVFSSALYCVGCVEGIMNNFGVGGYLVDNALPSGRWWEFLYGSVINSFNLVVCLVGATLFAKMSVLVLTVVLFCLGSVSLPEGNHLANFTNATYTGFSVETFHENLYPDFQRDYTTPGGPQLNFATVFGVLFSGVTGIMAGANMSDTTLNGLDGHWNGIEDFGVLLRRHEQPLWEANLKKLTLIRIGEGESIMGDLKDPSKSIPRGTISAIGFTFITYILLSLMVAATSSRQLLQITSALFLLSYGATNLACLSLDLASAPNFSCHFI
ncbi:unnamed protein product [Cyprideis torosa]|uniref:Amino acid permease/ SLC12A domain-containing protein n=1 Tax=Cyprideis torosa TaxID=163714 RepID=A0A7R8ZQ64_9CRUS|nr:unnamed protein product [Cyprideis torosa]CAG0902204.1 unnamed protein product [Cyprideis torosa]